MNIFFIKVKNFLFSKILYISILFLISVVIFFICFISTLNYNIVGACDSFFITAALLIGGGGLQIVGNQGTFDVMSYTTLFTCSTSFTILLDTFSKTSYGILLQTPVIKSVVSTARSAIV